MVPQKIVTIMVIMMFIFNMTHNFAKKVIKHFRLIFCTSGLRESILVLSLAHYVLSFEHETKSERDLCNSAHLPDRILSGDVIHKLAGACA